MNDAYDPDQCLFTMTVKPSSVAGWLDGTNVWQHPNEWRQKLVLCGLWWAAIMDSDCLLYNASFEWDQCRYFKQCEYCHVSPFIIHIINILCGIVIYWNIYITASAMVRWLSCLIQRICWLKSVGLIKKAVFLNSFVYKNVLMMAAH